jgi:hypothetical protein
MVPKIQLPPDSVDAQVFVIKAGQSAHVLAPFLYFPVAQVVTVVAVHAVAPAGQATHV